MVTWQWHTISLGLVGNGDIMNSEIGVRSWTYPLRPPMGWWCTSEGNHFGEMTDLSSCVHDRDPCLKSLDTSCFRSVHFKEGFELNSRRGFFFDYLHISSMYLEPPNNQTMPSTVKSPKSVGHSVFFQAQYKVKCLVRLCCFQRSFFSHKIKYYFHDTNILASYSVDRWFLLIDDFVALKCSVGLFKTFH